MEDSSTLAKLKTQVALLQKDAKTGEQIHQRLEIAIGKLTDITVSLKGCLLYTSDAADDSLRVDLGGRRIIK